VNPPCLLVDAASIDTWIATQVLPAIESCIVSNPSIESFWELESLGIMKSPTKSVALDQFNIVKLIQGKSPFFSFHGLVTMYRPSANFTLLLNQQHHQIC